MGGVSGCGGRRNLLLRQGLLGHDLLRGRLGGLLGHRSSGGTGRGGYSPRARIAVAGVVALALGGLAVALAHGVAPGCCSWMIGMPPAASCKAGPRSSGKAA